MAVKPLLKIHDAVEHDLQSSFLWYEQQSEGLGYDFIRAFQAGLDNILEFPYLAPRIGNGYDRRYVLSRFPYVIYYSPSVSTIDVYGVFHCSQAPIKMKRQVKKRKDK